MYLNRPNTLLLNSEQLYKVKQQLSLTNNTKYQHALERLLYEADQALNSGPYSVIYKEGIAPSGDKQDYWSVAPYWWPDPSTPSGLPYIRKDGVFNPDGYTNKYDKKNFMLLRDNFITLSLAYYFTEYEPYAEHASKLIRTWFIEKDTKMNPNMNYAQGIPGIVDGRQEGVLETEKLLNIIDGIQLISSSKNWTDTDDLGFNNWLSQYVLWLETNKLAVAERSAVNNHGTWYDAQYVAYLVYLGEISKAASYLKSTTYPRIECQIMPDGKMPLELARTRPFHYFLYNLEPFTMLAILADKIGIDLWNYHTLKGSSIKRAYDFIVPYILGETWPYIELKVDKASPVDNSEAPFARYLREAANKYRIDSYKIAADLILKDELYSHRSNLISPE